MSNARRVHDYEQLLAELSTMSRNLLVPYLNDLLSQGVPPTIAAQLVIDLQAQMIHYETDECDG